MLSVAQKGANAKGKKRLFYGTMLYECAKLSFAPKIRAILLFCCRGQLAHHFHENFQHFGEPIIPPGMAIAGRHTKTQDSGMWGGNDPRGRSSNDGEISVCFVFVGPKLWRPGRGCSMPQGNGRPLRDRLELSDEPLPIGL